MKNLKPTLSKTVLSKTLAVFLLVAVGVLGLSAVFSASAQTPVPGNPDFVQPPDSTTTTTTSTTTTTTTTTTPNSRAVPQVQQRTVDCDPQDHHWPAYVVGAGGMEVRDLASIYRDDLRWSGKLDSKFIYYQWNIDRIFGLRSGWEVMVTPKDTTNTLSEGTVISMYCTEAADQTKLDRLNLLHGHTEVSLHGGVNVIVAPETITRPADMRSSFIFNELLTNCQESPLLHAGIVTLQIRNLENGHWSYSNICDSDYESQVVSSDRFYYEVGTIHQGDIIYVDYWRCDACGFANDYEIYWDAGAREFRKVVPHVEYSGDDDPAAGSGGGTPPSGDPAGDDPAAGSGGAASPTT